MNLKSIICSSLLLLSGLTALANVELVNGGVYRITNRYNSLVMTAPAITGDITVTSSNLENPHQLWLAESNTAGTGYYLRDLVNGTYMTSPIKTGGHWVTTFTLEPDENTMSFIINDNLENTTIQALGYDSTHNVLQDGFANGNIVNSTSVTCWGNKADASKWKLTQVNLDEDAINAYKENWLKEEWHPMPIEPNRVYRFINAQYGHALTQNKTNNAICVAPDSDDESQLWLIEAAEDGSGYILRNYQSGSALISSMATSQPWSVTNVATPDPQKAVMHFELTEKGFAFEPQSVLEYTDNRKRYGYAHEAAGGKLVCWETNNATPTFWNITPVSEITEADIAAKRATWDYVVREGIETPLRQIFVDKACTELNTEFAAMSVEQIQQTAAYLALPETLRQMVIKVRNNDWSETDPVNPAIQWDSEHAKKFRVQMYEPYSDAKRAMNFTCIYPYTNLNNVTGILSDAGTTLYVMVEKGAAEGSTLYIAPRIFSDAVDQLNVIADGTELHEGLNIVPCEKDCAQMAIYYTVNTTEGRTRLRPLTDFDDIKIHIEGGSINGFFNSVGDKLYTADTNEDWFYYRERARFPRFCLISKHCMLYFHFINDRDAENHEYSGLKNLLTREEFAAGNFNLIATMNAWDDMFVAEQLVMGLMSDDVIIKEKAAGRDWYDTLEGDPVAPSDYHLYFNNRLMGISSTSGFMSATWYRTTYNIYASFCCDGVPDHGPLGSCPRIRTYEPSTDEHCRSHRGEQQCFLECRAVLSRRKDFTSLAAFYPS